MSDFVLLDIWTCQGTERIGLEFDSNAELEGLRQNPSVCILNPFTSRYPSLLRVSRDRSQNPLRTVISSVIRWVFFLSERRVSLGIIGKDS
jgi:hypothetical protein